MRFLIWINLAPITKEDTENVECQSRKDVSEANSETLALDRRDASVKCGSWFL